MNNKLITDVTLDLLKKDIPDFYAGDSVSVTSKIVEGDKTRSQVFKGIVIAIKGSGISKTFTVRKISHGVGVEKIWPIHSPMITKIEIIKKGKVRRSKLYYMRGRVGKMATKIEELKEDSSDISYLGETK